MTILVLLFLSTGPIVLMPCIIALFARHKNRLGILVANLMLWAIALVPLLGFQLSVVISLACWLSLFAYSVRATKSLAKGNESQSEA